MTVAIISLFVSIAAFVLAVALPAWERYSPPKAMVRPDAKTIYCLRVINRRRETLVVHEAWLEFDDGHRQPLFCTWRGARQRSHEIPARSCADFKPDMKADDGFAFQLVNTLDKTLELAGFCEEAVGHVWRSRPLDVSSEAVFPLAGWPRFKSWRHWQKRRLRARMGKVEQVAEGESRPKKKPGSG